MDVFRRILRDPDYLGKIPYYLETPNYTTIRPRACSQIAEAEMSRKCVEWAFLEGVLKTPDAEWAKAFKQLKQDYAKGRKTHEQRIQNVIKEKRKRNQHDEVVVRYDKDMADWRRRITRVGNKKRKLEGWRYPSREQPRKSCDALAMEESIELAVCEIQVKNGRALRPSKAKKGAYTGSGGLVQLQGEYMSAATGTRSSTRTTAALAADSPRTPASTGGGAGSGIRRTRSMGLY